MTDVSIQQEQHVEPSKYLRDYLKYFYSSSDIYVKVVSEMGDCFYCLCFI